MFPAPEMEEKDIEKGLQIPALSMGGFGEKTGETASSGSSSTTEREPGFERTCGAANRSLGRDTARADKTASLRRECSNNGYGCDDLVDGESGPGDGIGGGNDALDERDPFEVGWDGENDLKNPRNMPKWQKWVIIGITSLGSFCV